jgi:hypothetical protein
MRKLIGSIAFAASLSLASVPSAIGAPVAGVHGVNANGNAVHLTQFWRGGRCERLRRACEFKGQRGEVGEGNCRRYRAECGGRASYCERLRRACYNKDVRGEVGQGNCRRYRSECGGR